jgi:hypothetical protein
LIRLSFASKLCFGGMVFISLAVTIVVSWWNFVGSAFTDSLVLLYRFCGVALPDMCYVQWIIQQFALCYGQKWPQILVV